MFQTDIIFFLQSFGSPILTAIMKVITGLGNKEFFVLLLLGITAGIDFRKGFILIHILIITGLVTEIFKTIFALPRPWFVDSSLNTFGNNLSTTFMKSGAQSFFGALPDDVITSYRQLSSDSFGLPSGHTSSAVALWGTLMILFRNKIVRFVSISLLILIPLSRIYLARHFLADVLAGYVLGSIILLIFYLIVLNRSALTKYLSKPNYNFEFNVGSLFLFSYYILLPIVLLYFLPENIHELIGFLFGINFAYLFLCRKNYPKPSKGIFRLIITTLLTLVIFLTTGAVVTLIRNYVFDNVTGTILFVQGFLITFIGLSLCILLFRKLNWQ